MSARSKSGCTGHNVNGYFVCGRAWGQSSVCGHVCGRAPGHVGLCWCGWCGWPADSAFNNSDQPADYTSTDGAVGPLGRS